ncbi:MAG: hypothetical protein AWU55_461 [Halomonadaceae bacterium T82-2]|nr:MAG: hypothetical protein AWU55_461 [Halomonadaceae bacterium T82-2]
MKVVNVNDARQREACLARLCAEVYGRDAGLVPLASFAGTLGVLVRQDAARILALTDDDGRPAALALLVSDARGESMELALLGVLPETPVENAAERLVAELATRAPLRVNAVDADQETMFHRAGIERWLSGPEGQRIGLAPRHPEAGPDTLPVSLNFDVNAVVQSFKQDRELFDGYKARFVRGLEQFPAQL